MAGWDDLSREFDAWAAENRTITCWDVHAVLNLDISDGEVLGRHIHSAYARVRAVAQSLLHPL